MNFWKDTNAKIVAIVSGAFIVVVAIGAYSSILMQEIRYG